MTLAATFASGLVAVIVLGAWAYLAHVVWTHQQEEFEHSHEDIKWEGKNEPNGRR